MRKNEKMEKEEEEWEGRGRRLARKREGRER